MSPVSDTFRVVSLDELLMRLLGQDYPTLDVSAGQQWEMSNYALYYAVRALAAQVQAGQLVQVAQQALLSTLATSSDQQSTQVRVLTAQMQLAQTDNQALLAGQAADRLRLTALEAKDVLIASATEANRLDIVALQAEARALELRAAGDEAALAAAQATASQARELAAAAMKKAEDNATALQLVQAKADTAQTAATAAQQAQAAFAARFRTARVAVPAIGVGLTVDVVVAWSPAFADANYTAIAEPAGLTLLGLDATELTSARTSGTATFRIKNVANLAVAAGGTLNIIALS